MLYFNECVELRQPTMRLMRLSQFIEGGTGARKYSGVMQASHHPMQNRDLTEETF
jgi:hypothetical protein